MGESTNIQGKKWQMGNKHWYKEYQNKKWKTILHNSMQTYLSECS